MSEPIGERVKGLQIQMIAVEKGQAEIVKRLDKSEEATELLSRKIDMVLSNQADSTKERALIQSTIDAMQPHVDTVAEIKRLGGHSKIFWMGLVAFVGYIADAQAGLIKIVSWIGALPR
jgi:hypothetical protein